MAIRKYFQGRVRGNSVLQGYNYGEYPKHNFRSINEPEHIYPFWTSSVGPDEWHCKCYRERKNSDTFAIEYVQEGIFIFQQNNITYRVLPGEIFLVNLGKNSSMRCETEFALKKTVIMEGVLLPQTLSVLGLDRVDVISSPDHAQLDHYFDRLYELNGENRLKSRRESSGLCYSLLVELAEIATIRQRPAELQKALDYIHSHLTEPVSLDELVRYAGTSKATLHRQFRKYLQTSPVNYWLDQKLERAKSLLQTHPYSVKEVAEMLCYASSQYFAAEFKKKYGVSPKTVKCRLIG
ncbi:MAG: AraC family transcriptional regulator [Lentisphaerae bacterium]|nr:AraC family transcriptional regulator [Lentisphaerota bacterium]